MTAVTYYTTSYEFISRILVLPVALVGVMFPAFAEMYFQKREQAVDLYSKSVKFVVLITFPVIVLIVLFAKEGMTIWLGGEFAANTYSVLQWLAIGIFFNGLAFVPYSFLQGIGKPDITTKFHLVEVIIYLPLLLILLKNFGIVGGAIAWLVRVLLDCLLLFVFAKRYYEITAFNCATRMFIYLSLPLLILLKYIAFSVFAKIFVVIVIFALAFLFAYFKMLNVDEKQFFKKFLAAHKVPV